MRIVARRWGHDPVHHQIRWLWVLAFARTTSVERPCANIHIPHEYGLISFCCSVACRTRLAVYPGGHMFYSRDGSRQAFRKEVEALVK